MKHFDMSATRNSDDTASDTVRRCGDGEIPDLTSVLTIDPGTS